MNRAVSILIAVLIMIGVSSPAKADKDQIQPRKAFPGEAFGYDKDISIKTRFLAPDVYLTPVLVEQDASSSTPLGK